MARVPRGNDCLVRLNCVVGCRWVFPLISSSGLLCVCVPKHKFQAQNKTQPFGFKLRIISWENSSALTKCCGPFRRYHTPMALVLVFFMGGPVRQTQVQISWEQHRILTKTWTGYIGTVEIWAEGSNCQFFFLCDSFLDFKMIGCLKKTRKEF